MPRLLGISGIACLDKIRDMLTFDGILFKFLNEQKYVHVAGGATAEQA